MTDVQDVSVSASQPGLVEIRLEAEPAIGFALAHSGMPVIRELQILNRSGRAFAGVRVTVELKALGETVGEPWDVEVPSMAAVGLSFDNVAVRLDPVVMADLEERRPGEIIVTVSSDDGLNQVSRHPVDVLAHNQWQLYLDDSLSFGLLAPFVQPNHPLVQEVLARARDILQAKTSSSATQGYQEDANRVVEIAQAIYLSLGERGINYSNPPASWDQGTQKVRLAGEVLGDGDAAGVGTCLDTTVTFAACLEAAGLRPVLVLIHGHAFVAVSTRDDTINGRESVLTDVNTFVNLLDAGVLVPIETTMLTESPLPSFADAIREARGRLAAVGLEGFNGAVDVFVTRKRGLTPLPAVRRRVDGTVEVVAYQAVAATDFRTPEQRKAEAGPQSRRRDQSPVRIQRWKTALLDLSLRNPLLNLPSGDTRARVLIPPGTIGGIEDFLHKGGELTLQAHDLLSQEDQARGVRSVQELRGEELAEILREHEVLFLHYSTDTFVTRLRSLVRKARTSLEETGSSTLFLGLGTLSWELEGKPIVSPLVLVPLRVTGGTGRNKNFTLRLDDSGGSTPNFCLLEKLKECFDLEIPGLREPEEDGAGIDIDKAFQDVREAVLKAELPFRVDETGVLANLHFNTFRIWKDVDDHWLRFMDSPLVKHLVETPTQDFPTSAGHARPEVDLPLPCDESQYAAVQAAIAGETFVLEGPPGTGKSQTITNIVAGALAAGKRILFVAEKPAALEVVKRRLDAVGVGPLCLDLHGRTRKRSEVAAAIKRSLEIQTGVDQVEADSIQTELRTTSGELERYARALHTPNAVGYSAWTARQRLLAAGPGPVATVDLRDASLDATGLHAIRACLERLPEAARLAGLTPRHPWGLADGGLAIGDPIPLQQALTRLVEVRSALPLAHASLGPALLAAESADDFRALTTLIEQPLPPVAVLDQVASPGWEALYDDLVARLNHGRSQVPPIMSVFRPEAIGLPLDAILAAAREAAGASFLSRKGKLKQVMAQLEPGLRPGATADADKVVEMASALIAVRETAAQARGHVANVPGLVADASWNVYADTAMQQLDMQRVALASAAGLISQESAASQALRAIPGSASTVDQVTTATLRLVADAWQQVLSLLGASPQSVERWRDGRSLTDAWTDSAPAWTADAADGFRRLTRWQSLQADLGPLAAAGLGSVLEEILNGQVPPDDALPAFERGLAAASLSERWEEAHLDSFDGESHDLRVHRFARADQRWRSSQEQIIPDTVVMARPFAPGTVTGQVGDLLREVSKTRGGKSLRLLLEHYHETLATIMPCFMMSPESVAQFLRPGLFTFDLVIFDEASQIRVAEAVGALGRAQSAVVVGDSKQMPPTAFGMSRISAELVDEIREEDEVPEDQESILSECVEARIPRRWLTWHYRSQDESLIAFSNSHYYEGKLASFASPRANDPRMGLRFVKVDGQFLRSAKGESLRTNPEEARAIVAEVRRRLADPHESQSSIGVITFNAQQQALIDNLLQDCEDKNVQAAMARDDDTRLFVKSLENVQGDERDVILFSIAFSKDERGQLPLNFGPLNNAGGERRLNVAVTRARRQVVVFCSFNPEDIRLERTESVAIRHLQTYLKVARDGVAASAGLIARRPGDLDRHRAEIAAALAAAGLGVSVDVGLSEFRIDLVVAPTEAPDSPALAVLLDGPNWGAGRRVQDRDVLPSEVLCGLMGWPDVMRIWLPDWLRDRESCIQAAGSRASTAYRSLQEGLAPAPVVTPSEFVPAEVITAPEATPPTAIPSPAVPEPSETAPQQVEVVNSPTPIDGALDTDLREIDIIETQPAHDLEDLGLEDLDIDLFVPASEAAIASREVLDQLPDRAAAAQVKAQILDVIEAEGPVEVDRLARIVARRFGLAAVRAARAEAIIALVPRGRIRKHRLGTFAWPESRDPSNWEGFRAAGDGANRRIDEVAPEEIANAMLALLSTEEPPETEDDLIRDTAELFGIARISAQIRTRLEAVVKIMEKDGRIGPNE